MRNIPGSYIFPGAIQSGQNCLDNTARLGFRSALRAVLFSPGRVIVRPLAKAALGRERATAESYLALHLTGVWGDLSEGDKQVNDRALSQNGKLASRYVLPQTGQKLWIITEWDRSASTLLLPSEY